MPKQRVLVITTGGSIDKTYSSEASDFVVGTPIVKSYLRGCKCAHHVSYKELMRKDSLSLTDEDRELITETVRSARETSIVVTHGTDTMWKTALGVQEAAIAGNKVVVLTGAMRPAAFKESDAGFNLGAAFAAVQYLPPGAHVVMHGLVFSEPEKLMKDFKTDSFVEKDDNGAKKRLNGEPDGDDPPGEDPAPAPGVSRGRGRGRSRGRGRGRGRSDAPRSRRRAEAPDPAAAAAEDGRTTATEEAPPDAS
ncbi:hypothetical protein CTAYLR_000984 [Chrysophaeum taylorii]|uniref:L-asparaginase N-terminal domain-containing protein n=1 Tax=Chrysophaeum taylorii TaxID=2483200 RepID=A0AAD7UG06_9STRA|nr:hypothetical protein CTAYLR_000984 [Chrysophaeum taylorii]